MKPIAPAQHLRHIVLVVSGSTDTDEDAVPMLLRAGFDAIAVESAGATLALLESGVKPCVLVLDVDLPDLDAWKLWDHVRARGADASPAAVLVSADHVDGTRARLVEIPEFLRKPVAPDRLIEAVERHCPRRLWPRFAASDPDRP